MVTRFISGHPYISKDSEVLSISPLPTVEALSRHFLAMIPFELLITLCKKIILSSNEVTEPWRRWSDSFDLMQTH